MPTVQLVDETGAQREVSTKNIKSFFATADTDVWNVHPELILRLVELPDVNSPPPQFLRSLFSRAHVLEPNSGLCFTQSSKQISHLNSLQPEQQQESALQTDILTDQEALAITSKYTSKCTQSS